MHCKVWDLLCYQAFGYQQLPRNLSAQATHPEEKYHMKISLVPLLGVAALLFGCESTPHYNRTKVVALAEPQPKKPYGSVKLYQSKDAVPGTYEVIAMMSVAGKAGEEAQFIKAFLYRAADLGADGLILERVSLVAGSQGAWVGDIGGFNTIQDAVYRGETIRLK